jgi:N-acetylneuraminic acid mutarotase
MPASIILINDHYKGRQLTVSIFLMVLVIGLILPQTVLAIGSWSATGSLSSARTGHTATLLLDGKVLIAGGYNGTSVAASAELYDPATGIWINTGSMNSPCAGHTATLLRDGRVLVVGGGSSELYDPATGTWSPTGPLTAHGSYHTATLLRDGRVLVVGGLQTSETTLSRTDLYDPATGTWSPTGSLTAARFYHTATLLPSGKVLVAGGEYRCWVDGYTELADVSGVELYDPETGTWADTGSMNNGRFHHTATLLPSGKVLLAGGEDVYYYNGSYFSAYLTKVDIYDPPTGTWSATGSLSSTRDDHTATLLPNGQVLIVGGRNYNQSYLSYLASAELYNPNTGTWSATGSLSSARTGHTATLLPNGQVLVAGGYNGTSYLVSAELYDNKSRGVTPGVLQLLLDDAYVP